MKKSGSNANAASTNSAHSLAAPQLQARRSSAPDPRSSNAQAGNGGANAGCGGAASSSAGSSVRGRRGSGSVPPHGATRSPPGPTAAAALLLAGTNLGKSRKSSWVPGLARSACTSPVAGCSAPLVITPAVGGGGGGGGSGAAGGGNGAAAGGQSGDKTGSPRHRTSNDAWVCPNDRQLALRAKLHSGWSVKTANLNQWKQPEPMSSDEHDLILKVIEKADALEKAEMQRVGKLVDRLEGMKRCRVGNGETECVLCGEVFRFYHRSQKRCVECNKMTCGKCGLETTATPKPSGGRNGSQSSASGDSPGLLGKGLSSSTSFISASGLSTLTGLAGGSAGAAGKGETVWLCKICAEEKEMWKKSGAWFFKQMPTYVLPEGGAIASMMGRGGGRPLNRRFSHYDQFGHASSFCGGGPESGRSTPTSQSVGGGAGREEVNSSEEEGQLAKRRFHRVSNRSDISDESGPSSLQSCRYDEVHSDSGMGAHFLPPSHQPGQHPGLQHHPQIRNGHGRGGGSHISRHPHHLAGPRSRSTNALPVSELDQAAAILAASGGPGGHHPALGGVPYGAVVGPPSITIAPNGVPHKMVAGTDQEPPSPTSSMTSMSSTVSSGNPTPSGLGEHMSRSRPPHPRGPAGRSCSPRYYRPPPGSYGPPRGHHPPIRQGPPWAGPHGGPRGPPMFRPPHHVTNRSPSPSPPYSPRTGGNVIRRGGPPPPGHHPRYRGGPPRFRGQGPPRHGGPHHYPGAQSAPHSPVMPQRPFDGGVRSPPGSTCSEYSPPINSEGRSASPIQRHGGMRRPSRLMGMAGGLLAAATGNVSGGTMSTNSETTGANGSAPHIVNSQPPCSAPTSSSSQHVQGASSATPSDPIGGTEDIGDDEYSHDEREDVAQIGPQSQSQYQMRIEPSSKSYSKAKPIGEKENKFTSTLRRLSTVRKRNKSKRKSDKLDKTMMEKDSVSEVGEFALETGNGSSQTGNGSGHVGGHVTGNGAGRPSSTTSRESEAEVVTSGYFSRQESQSRGSDETLSSPRSPEGSYGTIEFSLVHDEPNRLLVVSIAKAKKIKGMDINGLSDSYCKVTIMPATGKNGNQNCTKTVPRSINPSYNSTLHFGNITADSINRCSLSIAILDEDLAGDHLLAETTLSLKKLLYQSQKKFQLPLERPNLKNTHEGLIVASNVGQVEVSLAFYAKSGTLKVTIVQCLNLPQMDESGSANPFVKVVLHPVTKTSKNQTTVKWKSLNPDFHEQFVYQSSVSDLPKQSLYITVWDREKGRQDEYIGGVIIGMCAKGGRLSHWSDMIKNPSQVQKRTHFLSANFLD